MIEPAELHKKMERYVHSSDHPDLQVYRQGMFDHGVNEVWYWRTKHFCDLGHFYGNRILEIGSGFGWDAVGLSLIGNNSVVASDILPSMTDGVRQCLDGMRSRGETLDVSALQGDICNLDLPAESFDGIFSTEAIEHVHSLDDMFSTCWRLLRKGGRLVIVNDSNRFNPASRAHSWNSWADRDDSWDHVNWLKREVRPVEHADAKPYGVMREEHIRKYDERLTDDEVALLRQATAGLVYRQIDSAIDRYKLDGKLPVRDEFGWSRNPETGEYSERLLDPFELAVMMKKAGFKVHIEHLFRKFPLRLLNRNGLPALQKLIFHRRPHFVLVAQKT